MNAELEVLKDDPAAKGNVVLATDLTVTEDEAAKILEELGLVEIQRAPGVPTTEKAAVGIDVRKQLRLGAFGDDLGAVRLDRGAIMIAERIIMNHMLRLNHAASKMTAANELKEIAYPLGYLAGQLAKAAGIGIKAKVILEPVAAEERKPRTESWTPGTVLKPATAA